MVHLGGFCVVILLHPWQNPWLEGGTCSPEVRLLNPPSPERQFLWSRYNRNQKRAFAEEMGKGDQSLTRRELKHSQFQCTSESSGCRGRWAQEAAQRTEGRRGLHKHHPSCVAKHPTAAASSTGMICAGSQLLQLPVGTTLLVSGH